ncbi:hypothetical protein BSQ49_11045 [Liquorilactobacillus hordei]|uniref:Uncharacterized protein n=1 Tax=Liquorilactobacillus hordei TaxID=468911 RepID=A0A3Q8CKX6_9LACO|nr:hypothetical protein BSQ49_11045 [Liquorilactobacillus hordei]
MKKHHKIIKQSKYRGLSQKLIFDSVPYLIFTTLNKPQVLLVGVKKALAIKTSFRYNSFWLPTKTTYTKGSFCIVKRR